MSIQPACTGARASGYVCEDLPGFPDILAIRQAHPRRYPCLLESAARGAAPGRYDILFAYPGSELVLTADAGLFLDGVGLHGQDFLSTFERLWLEEAIPPRSNADVPRRHMPPFCGGWFVYLGYELAHQIEPVLKDIPREPVLPLARAMRFPAAIVRDRLLRTAYLVCEDTRARELLARMHADVRRAGSERTEAHRDSRIELATLREEADELFLERFQRIQEYIRAGDVFQVNLSRLWRAALSAPVTSEALYHRLRAANPAPFAGLMTLNEHGAILSSSPERLVAVTGRTIRTRPIAGTYPRSRDRAQDRAWSRDLMLHPKERAEHVMLIDLERNDLGRLCRPGTVKVDQFMVLESYRHVHHIVSEITGQLRSSVTPAGVIRAVFPGGTITGCPKLRCMQIIAELEQAPRGAYTGSMGYVNHDGSLDFNILIRTLVRQDAEISIRAGAGIVADSMPERELNETRAKAKGMLAALGAA